MEDFQNWRMQEANKKLCPLHINKRRSVVSRNILDRKYLREAVLELSNDCNYIVSLSNSLHFLFLRYIFTGNNLSFFNIQSPPAFGGTEFLDYLNINLWVFPTIEK